MVNTLHEILKTIQEQMASNLKMSKSLNHPGQKGEIHEYGWRSWMETYLPKKYSVTTGKVIDCKGETSDQIDIIIYDRFHTPVILDQGYLSYVAAESVYAVFEVKSRVDKDNITYAIDKAKSVRKLTRTSAVFSHASGQSQAKDKHIIAGILSYDDGEPIDFSKFSKLITSVDEIGSLDFACSIGGGGFMMDTGTFKLIPQDNSLVSFLYNFLRMLQMQGTAQAADYIKYLDGLGLSI